MIRAMTRLAYWTRQVAAVAAASALSLVGFAARYLVIPQDVAPVGVFVVEPGCDAFAVAARLDSLGLLASRDVWLGYARLTGVDRELKAGPYLLDGLSPAEIAKTLHNGAILEHRVTVPEGSTVWEVAAIVEREVGTPHEAFLEAAHSPGLLSAVGSPGPTLEGYLFPDTYRLYRGITAERVAAAMTDRFLAVWAELAEGVAPPEGFSRHELVTMASLVEAEAALDEERPRIASVYYNRLRIGMRLMADPTVAYAMGSRPRRLLYEHLRIDSPYNTYLYPGLPPGPVCNPGAASLAAALTPLEGCRDLYFVAAGDGSHIFSRTHRDHIYAKSEANQRRRDGAPPADTRIEDRSGVSPDVSHPSPGKRDSLEAGGAGEASTNEAARRGGHVPITGTQTRPGDTRPRAP
jgi:UPF0755 protein